VRFYLGVQKRAMRPGLRSIEPEKLAREAQFRFPRCRSAQLCSAVDRKKRIYRRALFGNQGAIPLHFLLLCVVALVPGYCLCQARPTRRILILNETGPSNPASNIIEQGIRDGLQNSSYRIEFYREYMETILFPDPADQQRFRNFYFEKYKNRRPDLIITAGPSPLRFVAEAHKQFFPGIPIVFCMPNGGAPGSPILDSDFTGVENDLSALETVKVARRLLPGTEYVFVVGGTSVPDRRQEGVVREQLNGYDPTIKISYLTNLSMPDLLQRISHLPDHSIVLFVALGQDATGTRFISGEESGPMVAAAANAPEFALFDIYLNHGEVGGYLSSISEQGRIAGSIALRILNGEKARDIPRARAVISYIFDWKALKRWGIKENLLPPGSTVLNRQRSVWSSYKWYIAVGISLIILEAVLISALLWQRTRTRKAELELAAALKTAQESEQRFRHVANTAPVMIWMSGTDKLCTYVNQPWLDFTNRTFSEELGNGRLESIHSEDVPACLDTYTQAFERQEPFTMQYRLRRHDGEYRWVLDRGIPRFDANHSFAGYIGSCVDITDRKLAEEALSTVSRRLIGAQEQERTRIARELHDNINQRVAMLGIELDVLQQSLPASTSDVQLRLEKLRQLASDIGVEIQGISHRLHSSKLEYLGLVAACKSFCHETAEWHKVQVSFTTENVPPVVPQDISLCLFRVLQESLSNSIKHSGAQRFEVQLRGVSGEIQLVVRDNGVGFDAAAAMISRGLGLISMRERVSLVNGIMLITSSPTDGTEIRVGVPMAKDTSQAASGAA